MKKYTLIGLLVFFSLIFFPLVSKAAYYGFLDGKFYDSTGDFSFFCLMDSNCYDINSKFKGSKNDLLGPDAGPVFSPAVSGNLTTPETSPSIPAPVIISSPVTNLVNQTSQQIILNDLFNFQISPNINSISFEFKYAKVGYHAPTKLPQIGDKYSVTLSNILEKIYDGKLDIYGYPASTVINFENLISNTEYPYSVRIDRGNTYGIATGTVSTLSN